VSAPRFRLGVLLRARSLLTVASGREGFPVDATVYRLPSVNGLRVPVVPGPSFKGVLRKSASKVAWLLGLTSCYSIRPEPEFTCLRRWRRPCDIHLVFGAPGKLRSQVEVSQFIPVKGKEEAEELFRNSSIWFKPYSPLTIPQTLNVTRVGLRDDACVASPGLLYTYEELPIGVSLYGEVAVVSRDDSVKLKAIKLVLGGLANLRLDRLGRAGIVDAIVVAASPSLQSLVARDPLAQKLLNGLRRGWWF